MVDFKAIIITIFVAIAVKMIVAGIWALGIAGVGLILFTREGFVSWLEEKTSEMLTYYGAFALMKEIFSPYIQPHLHYRPIH